MAVWSPGRVVDNRRVNRRLTSLIIDAETGPFEPGQFVRVGLPDGDDVLARAYSLVNTPAEPYLEVFFNLVEEGPLSPRLFALEPGDEVLVSANPSGFLTLDEVPDCAHLWMMATGTGVGPFLSILKSETVWRRFSRVLLCYSVRSADELAYTDLIAELGGKHPDQFTFVPIVTREAVDGALGQRLPALLRDGSLEARAGLEISAEDSHIMMCGSQAMIAEVGAALGERGMRKHLRRKPGHFISEKYH